MNPVRNSKRPRPLLIVSIIVSAFCATLVLGQGGTGREPSNTNTTKKTPARKTPTRRTSNTTQSNEPSSQTDSQPAATPAPTPAAVESAGPEPSLNQTMEWLGAKLTDGSFFNWLAIGADNYLEKVDYHVSGDPPPQVSFSVDHCTLVLTATEYTYDGGTRELARARIVIPFGDIEPRSIEDCSVSGSYQSGYCLRMKTSGSRKTFTASKDYTEEYAQRNGGNIKRAEASVSLFFRDYEGKERAKKAIGRAVQLCGGKRDPF